jgi:hypothetical protein
MPRQRVSMWHARPGSLAGCQRSTLDCATPDRQAYLLPAAALDLPISTQEEHGDVERSFAHDSDPGADGGCLHDRSLSGADESRRCDQHGRVRWNRRQRQRWHKERWHDWCWWDHDSGWDGRDQIKHRHNHAPGDLRPSFYIGTVVHIARRLLRERMLFPGLPVLLFSDTKVLPDSGCGGSSLHQHGLHGLQPLLSMSCWDARFFHERPIHGRHMPVWLLRRFLSPRSEPNGTMQVFPGHIHVPSDLRHLFDSWDVQSGKRFLRPKRVLSHQQLTLLSPDGPVLCVAWGGGDGLRKHHLLRLRGLRAAVS